MQCGNAHNEHNERGGESIRRMYPLPLSLSLALHSSGGGYLGQGNKGHQLLSLYALQSNSFKIYDFPRSLLHLEDVETANGENILVGIVGLPPIWAIYISTLVSSPQPPAAGCEYWTQLPRASAPNTSLVKSFRISISIF